MTHDLAKAAWRRVARLYYDASGIEHASGEHYDQAAMFEEEARRWIRAVEQLVRLPNNPSRHIEILMWENLTSLMEKVGAITKADLVLPADDISTPGSRLLTALRQWAKIRERIAASEKDAP